MNIDYKKVQDLIDKQEIHEATLRYTRGIDRHDDEIMASAYHPDATDDHGAYIGDAAGFIGHAHRSHAIRDVHHHYIMNQTIDLDGDTAHVETYFLAALRRKNGPVDMSGGRYIDRFERRDGRWAIADRVCMVEWRGLLPERDVPTGPALFLSGRWDKSDLSYQRPLQVTRPHRDLGP